MRLWRKLTYLMPAVRRREDRDIQDELDSLRRLAGPGKLGNIVVAAEEARSALGWPSLERLVQDIRYSLRAMGQRRAFTALVITSLALGIGATTAIYSFIDAILLRSLPVQDPQSLVVLKWRAKHYTLASGGMSWSTNGSSFDPTTGTLSSIFPYGALSVFQQSDDVLAGAFGYFSNENQALTIGDGTDTVKVHYVSGSYFAGMGVRPVAGRLLGPADDQPGGAIGAMLSERMARSRFGNASTAIGQTVRVNDQPVTVVGITPAAFFGAEPGATPDVFLPLHAQVTISTGWTADVYRDDHFYWLEVMARLKPNVSVTQARAVLAARFHAFVAGTATTEAQQKDLPNLVVEPGSGGLDSLRRQYAQPLYILMTMVALMLLIACANVANLLLARAASRGRELAIRLSLGATRARLVCQLLTESVLLASVGGALGLVVAWWGIRVLTAWLATGHTNLTLNADLNLPVLAVTSALSVFSGLLFGLVPALRATRVDAAQALKAVRAGELRASRRGAGQTLVVAQVALSFVLLVGAGLFGRTLANLHAIPLGFDRDDVLIFTLLPQQVGYRGPSLVSIFETVQDRLRTLPGVQGVGLSAGAPPTGGGSSTQVTIVGASIVAGPGVNEKPYAAIASVGPDFFRTLRMPVRGREFTALDTASAPGVVIVNHRLADLFGLATPIGRTLRMPRGDYTIVGVADDSVIFGLKEERRSIAYLSYLQLKRPLGGMVYEVRTSGEPLALAPAVRDAVRQVDRRLAISDLQTEAAHVDQEIGSQIALARLCSAFAGLALVLACVGVYGTVAFTVSRRTNELGIRMTLGAQRSTIVWMVVRGIIWLTLGGLGIGVPVVLAGSRLVGTLLYGITPTDPELLAVALVGLIGCALVAGWIPARRAARIDPMMAIRQE